MAVVRARSAPPYGLFAAVAVAVVCAGAAIVFYVMWNKQTAEHDDAINKLQKLATASDQTTIMPKYQPATGERSSILANMSKKIDTLTTDLVKAQADRDRAVADLQNQTSTLARANESATSAAERASASERNSQTALRGSQQSLAEKDAAIKKIQDELTAMKTSYDQAVAEGEKKINDAQVKAEQDARDQVLKLEAANATIARQELDIKDLRAALIAGRKGTDVAVGEPDGNVIRVDGASDLAWISLTKADRVKPGMTFTTYDPRTGVRFATEEQALGNGSLEIIEVGEASSLARITRTSKNRAIQAGDMISNLVYHHDKTRQFRFVIVGDFDLDGDGIATANERERIIRMVQSWGGAVDNNVSSQTDYLVMGKPPASPVAVQTADEAATAPGSIVDQRSKEQQSYEQLDQDARRLAIPVLNANRFLAMIGYYNTTVVRY